MQQPSAHVITELPHVDRHFVVRRRDVATDLHIHITEPPGLIGKQMTSEPLVADTQPFRRNDDLIGLGLENLVVHRDERNCETFGEFLG